MGEASGSRKDGERNKRGRRNWTPEQRKLYSAWHNYYPTLVYARNDPKTFYVAIDHAAWMAGMNQCGFYNRYLLSGELPYVVNVVVAWEGPTVAEILHSARSAVEDLDQGTLSGSKAPVCAAQPPEDGGS